MRSIREGGGRGGIAGWIRGTGGEQGGRGGAGPERGCRDGGGGGGGGGGRGDGGGGRGEAGGGRCGWEGMCLCVRAFHLPPLACVVAVRCQLHFCLVSGHEVLLCGLFFSFVFMCIRLGAYACL